jgi:hypothetical protein
LSQALSGVFVTPITPKKIGEMLATSASIRMHREIGEHRARLA